MVFDTVFHTFLKRTLLLAARIPWAFLVHLPFCQGFFSLFISLFNFLLLSLPLLLTWNIFILTILNSFCFLKMLFLSLLLWLACNFVGTVLSVYPNGYVIKINHTLKEFRKTLLPSLNWRTKRTFLFLFLYYRYYWHQQKVTDYSLSIFSLTANITQE